jgi:hypothetical protein
MRQMEPVQLGVSFVKISLFMMLYIGVGSALSIAADPARYVSSDVFLGKNLSTESQKISYQSNDVFLGEDLGVEARKIVSTAKPESGMRDAAQEYLRVLVEGFDNSNKNDLADKLKQLEKDSLIQLLEIAIPKIKLSGRAHGEVFRASSPEKQSND